MDKVEQLRQRRRELQEQLADVERELEAVEAVAERDVHAAAGAPLEQVPPEVYGTILAHSNEIGNLLGVSRTINRKTSDYIHQRQQLFLAQVKSHTLTWETVQSHLEFCSQHPLNNEHGELSPGDKTYLTMVYLGALRPLCFDSLPPEICRFAKTHPGDVYSLWDLNFRRRMVSAVCQFGKDLKIPKHTKLVYNEQYQPFMREYTRITTFGDPDRVHFVLSECYNTDYKFTSPVTGFDDPETALETTLTFSFNDGMQMSANVMCTAAFPLYRLQGSKSPFSVATVEMAAHSQSAPPAVRRVFFAKNPLEELMQRVDNVSVQFGWFDSAAGGELSADGTGDEDAEEATDIKLRIFNTLCGLLRQSAMFSYETHIRAAFVDWGGNN